MNTTYRTPYSSLPINDPDATHRVITAHLNLGFGVFGYYNELVANTVRDDLEAASYECRVEPHSISTLRGVHPVIVTGKL